MSWIEALDHQREAKECTIEAFVKDLVGSRNTYGNWRMGRCPHPSTREKIVERAQELALLDGSTIAGVEMTPAGLLDAINRDCPRGQNPNDPYVEFIQPWGHAVIRQYSPVMLKTAYAQPSETVCLVVEDPAGGLWGWGKATSTSRSGNIAEWRLARVQFGIFEDAGREFTLYGLLTDHDVPARQIAQIPPHRAIDVIQVTRE